MVSPSDRLTRLALIATCITVVAVAAILQPHFVRVTGAFDELLGPNRGWTYLFAFSPNHEAAKRLALKAPDCPNGSSGSTPQEELIEIVPKVATAI
jgi:hypothetical protein